MIQIYLTGWCGKCGSARQWLEENNIEYEEIDIEESTSAAELLEAKTGNRSVPYFVIDEQWVKGYDAAGFRPELILPYLKKKKN